MNNPTNESGNTTMQGTQLTASFAERLEVAENVDGLTSLGFVHRGCFIVDPLVSECSRFQVEPSEYDLTREEADFICGFNRSLDEATDAAINAGCLGMQSFLGVTSGDFAGSHFSGEAQRSNIRRALAEYALEEIDSQLRQQGLTVKPRTHAKKTPA